MLKSNCLAGYSKSSYESHWGIEINAGVADIVQDLSQTAQREIIMNTNTTPTTPTQCCRVRTECGIASFLMPGFHNRTCCPVDEGCPPVSGICDPLTFNLGAEKFYG